MMFIILAFIIAGFIRDVEREKVKSLLFTSRADFIGRVYVGSFRQRRILLWRKYRFQHTSRLVAKRGSVLAVIPRCLRQGTFILSQIQKPKTRPCEQVLVEEAGGVEPHPVISGTIYLSGIGQSRLASASILLSLYHKLA